jgi:hypothetical protein
MKSLDGGVAWSDTVGRNDDPVGNGADQFRPWIAGDSTGTITVIFYDRRNDPNNLRFDLYMTQSYDGGESFTTNERITTTSSLPIGRAGLIGEYIGLTSYNGIPMPLWTDTREGSQDVYYGVHMSLGARESSRRVICKIFLSSTIFRDHLTLYSNKGKLVQLALYDLSGRFLYRMRVYLNPGRNILSLPLTPSGFYILQVDKRTYRILRLL